MKRYAIGIDIGGTSARLGLVTRGARIVNRITIPCSPSKPWRKLLGDIADAAATLVRDGETLGVGIGCAGCVDGASGVVHSSPNLPSWKRVPIKRFMEDRLGLPSILDNDVNMISLGEFRYGAARGKRNVFCITIGTGVGGAFIVDGKLYRGQVNTAGEVGHIQVEPEGRACACGNRGCLERYIGKDGLAYLARRAMRGRRSVLKRSRILTPIVIEEAARKGDSVALAVWEKAGYYLGLAMVGVVNLLTPDIVVLGGGISRAGRLLLDPAKRVVRERALAVPARHVRIVRSKLGNDGGVIGAASELFRRLSS